MNSFHLFWRGAHFLTKKGEKLIFKTTTANSVGVASFFVIFFVGGDDELRQMQMTSMSLGDTW